MGRELIMLKKKIIYMRAVRLLQNAIMKIHSNEISSVRYLKVYLLPWIFIQAAIFLAITLIKNFKINHANMCLPWKCCEFSNDCVCMNFHFHKIYSSPFPFSYKCDWVVETTKWISWDFEMVAALHKQQIISKECQKQGWPETVNEQAMGKNMITKNPF